MIRPLQVDPAYLVELLKLPAETKIVNARMSDSWQAVVFLIVTEDTPAAALDAGSQITGSGERSPLGDDPHRGGLG